MATLKVRGKTLTNDISFNGDNVNTQNITTNNTTTASLYVSGQTQLQGPAIMNDNATFNASTTFNDSITMNSNLDMNNNFTATYTDPSTNTSMSISMGDGGFIVDGNNYAGNASNLNSTFTVIGSSNTGDNVFQIRQTGAGVWTIQTVPPDINGWLSLGFSPYGYGSSVYITTIGLNLNNGSNPTYNKGTSYQTRAAIIDSTLSVTGDTVSLEDVTASGTLNVVGNTTLSNASLSGTLSVTGESTLATTTISSLSVNGGTALTTFTSGSGSYTAAGPFSSTSGSYNYMIIGSLVILSFLGLSDTSTSSSYFTITEFNSLLVPENTTKTLVQVETAASTYAVGLASLTNNLTTPTLYIYSSVNNGVFADSGTVGFSNFTLMYQIYILQSTTSTTI